MAAEPFTLRTQTTTEPCEHCDGEGTISRKCCTPADLESAPEHPLNDDDLWRSGINFRVRQCKECGQLWGIRHQYDPGTGSDNIVAPLNNDNPRAFFHHGDEPRRRPDGRYA